MGNNPAERGIGAALAAVLPQDGLRWWQKPYLVYLNFCIVSLFLFSSANGYDGSMMNGLQALPQWQEALHHPKYVYDEHSLKSAAEANTLFFFPQGRMARLAQCRPISGSFLLLPRSGMV